MGMGPFPALGIHSAGAVPIHPSIRPSIHPRFLLARSVVPFFSPFVLRSSSRSHLILYKFHFLDNLPVAVAVAVSVAVAILLLPLSLLGRG